jgi:hypothetical protein
VVRKSSDCPTLHNALIIKSIKSNIAGAWRFSATSLSLPCQRTNTHISVLASMLENMEEIYLSEKLKAEYLRDFNEFVLSETHESWKIHPKIKDHLIKLNQCSNFQTLYSAYPERSQTSSVSYLKIAYSKIVELELLRSTIPYFLIMHNSDRNSKFNYRFYQNKDNANYREGPRNFKMGCLTDSQYFKVNHLRMEFKNFDIQAHDGFWANLTNTLIELDEKHCS